MGRSVGRHQSELANRPSMRHDSLHYRSISFGSAFFNGLHGASALPSFKALVFEKLLKPLRGKALKVNPLLLAPPILRENHEIWIVVVDPLHLQVLPLFVFLLLLKPLSYVCIRRCLQPSLGAGLKHTFSPATQMSRTGFKRSPANGHLVNGLVSKNEVAMRPCTMQGHTQA